MTLKRLFSKKHKINFQKGYSLVEVLIFVLIFTLVLSVVVSVAVVITSLYREIKISRNIGRDAGVVLEKISFEAGNAESINQVSSILNAHPGKLVLISNAGASTTEIYIDNGSIKLKKNGVDFGSLTSSSTVPASLVFRLIDNGGVSQAVKTEITLKATSTNRVFLEKFYLTTLLRNSY